jgi:hypothetical protein
LILKVIDIAKKKERERERGNERKLGDGSVDTSRSRTMAVD